MWCGREVVLAQAPAQALTMPDRETTKPMVTTSSLSTAASDWSK